MIVLGAGFGPNLGREKGVFRPFCARFCPDFGGFCPDLGVPPPILPVFNAIRAGDGLLALRINAINAFLRWRRATAGGCGFSGLGRRRPGVIRLGPPLKWFSWSGQSLLLPG